MNTQRNSKNTKPSKSLLEALRGMLIQGASGNQQEINRILTNQGYHINQSKVSRMLRKLGAVKIKGASGKLIYHLPQEPAPSAPDTPLANLITDITTNENLIIVQTSPGSASLIARLLDYNKKNIGILGTIAGDDTIFVAPYSINNISQTLLALKNLLRSYNH
jgi:transcriptional regulator of arginine metabolism